MIELGLLTGKRFMLDLGCGNGQDSEFFKGIGYTVTSVDIEPIYKGVIKADIREFNIKKDSYGVIICNNVLPFVPDKEAVKKILSSISRGLTKDGVACISVFGPDDDWTKHSRMSFFKAEEISTCVETIGMEILEKVTTEGYGKTMTGDTKYWHVIRLLLRKNK